MPPTPDATEVTQDVTRTLLGFVERKLRLDLSTLEIAFLGLLRLRGSEASVATFTEDQLFDAFEHACHVADPGAENVRTRASHALRRLREQQFLVRVDAAGVVRAGEYALSRLALGVIDFYLEEQVLSRDTLSPLTAALAATLSELVSKVRGLSKTEAPPSDVTSRWNAVVGTLDVTCRELLIAIERRQLGLDHQQEAFQKEIAALLSADWFGSIEHCQSLLDTSAAALSELNEVLMRDTQQLHALLADLVQLLSEYSFLERTPYSHTEPPTGDTADTADTALAIAGDDFDERSSMAATDDQPGVESPSEDVMPEPDEVTLQLRILADRAMRAAVAVADQVDRIATWGAARQKAWTDYYDYVHRYLRDVVRLDPSRALSQRLRQQLMEHGVRPFALAVATDSGMRVLRDPEPLEPPAPVRRPRKPREKDPEPEATVDDPMLVLERAVRDAVTEGARTLQDVTRRLTAQLDPNEQFLMAGRIAEIFGRLPQSFVEHERQWVTATPDLSIEQRHTRPFPFEDES